MKLYTKKLCILIILLIAASTTFAQSIIIPAYKNPRKSRKEILDNIKRDSLSKIKGNPMADSLKSYVFSNKFSIAPLLNMTTDNIKKSSSNAIKDSINIFLQKDAKRLNSAQLKILRNNLQNTYDEKTLLLINEAIDSLKILNTNQFLSNLKPTKPFFIGNIRLYKVDSLNKYLYNQGNVSALQSAGIQNFTGRSTYVNAELASFLFGPIRMGLGGTFTTKGDSTKDNAIKSNIQKIVSNGGTINLNFSLPLFFSRTRNEQMHFGLYAKINNGINPGVDSTGNTDFSKNVSYVNQSGLNIHFDVGSNDGKALLSFDVPCYYVMGGNNLYQQIGVKDFSMIQLQIGAVFNNLFNIHISGPLYSSSKTIMNTPFIVSLQFSPGRVLGSN